MDAGHDRPFTRAFAAWFAMATDLHSVMVFEPCVDRDAVEIKFLTGGGALQGYAHAAGISISALWKDECWDFLFDRDVVAELGPSGWFCPLCALEDRKNFASIEFLWIDHLFRPLAEWVKETVMDSILLVFYQAKGATWARILRHHLNEDREERYLVELLCLDP